MSDERLLTHEDQDKVIRLLQSGTLEHVSLAISLLEETANAEDVNNIFNEELIVSLISSGDVDIFTLIIGFLIGRGHSWQRLFESVTERLVVVESGSYSQPSIHVRCLFCEKTEEIELGSHTCTNCREGFEGVEDADTMFEQHGWHRQWSRPTLGEDCNLMCPDCHGMGSFIWVEQESRWAGPGLTSSLSDAAAESYSKILQSEVAPPSEGSDETSSLDLSFLTSLSDTAAEVLSKYKGSGLYLNGLTSLSDTAATSLSEYARCRDKVEVTCKTCKATFVVKYNQEDYDAWNQDGQSNPQQLNYLTPGEHELLISRTCGACFDEMYETNAETNASRFEGRTWKGLDLSGLTSLSDAAAESLSKHDNLAVTLDNLPDSAAKILRDAGHG